MAHYFTSSLDFYNYHHNANTFNMNCLDITGETVKHYIVL